MTHQSDNTNPMKLLAKVARGLDLPAPEVSSPLQAGAPLLDDDHLDEQLSDNNASTSEPEVRAPVEEPAPQIREPVVEPAADTAKSESGPARPAMVGMSDDNLSPFETPRTDRSPGSTSPKNTAGLEPEIPSETFAYSASVDSNTESPGTIQPASPHAAAEPYEEIPGMQTEPLHRPDRILPAEKDPDAGHHSGIPRTRWFFHSAGEPKSKPPQPVSRMLRPVFDTSAKESPIEPGKAGKTENPISPGRQLELDGYQDLTQSLPEPAGTELPTHLPDIQPATGARNRIPSINSKAVSQLKGTRSATDKPMTSTNQPAVETAGSSASQVINRLQNKNAAARQISSPAAVSKDVLPAKTGGVSVGRINIQVRGKRQAEDDWPAPPRYSSHTITEDWEWSCHYGK